MRNTFFVAAVAAIAGTSFAQTPVNEYGVYPDSVTFATRVFIPTANVGDVTQRIDQGFARGVGNVAPATAGRINGWRGLVQDSDRTTGEQYTFAVIGDDPANPGQPDPNNDLIRTGTISTPSDTANTGGVAWIVTVTLTTPADVLPSTGSYHLGLGLTASPEQSTWAASYAAGTAGDNPRAGAPNLGFAIDRTAGSIITPSARTIRIFALTEAPTLRGGADIDPNFQRGPNPSFGAAGIYLDRTRMDGIALRIRDAASPGFSTATFLAAGGFNPTPVPLAGITGDIHLSPAGILPVAVPGVLDNMGELDQVVIAFPSNVPALGSIQLQTIVFDLNTGTTRASNGIEMNDA